MIFLPGWFAIASATPLFEGEEMLDVVIEAPIHTLVKQRLKEPEFEGTFRYTDASGTEQAFAVKVATRGHSRLELCDYPPLRITFNPDETKGTLFEDQRALKLVTQCKEGSTGATWLYLEHGIYRAYNRITDFSYRTRKLTVTYRETESRARDRVHPAFFLEPDKQLAKRLGRMRIRPPKVEPVQMAKVETTRNLLFQYLIGNTDIAMKRGMKGEGCCHNGRVYIRPGEQDDWVIVPYDFDYAGIVNTDYALPGRGLPIRRVTTRLYRGFCWQNELLPEVIELFNEKRSEIESALVPTELSKSKARGAQKYVDKFYDIVNDPEKLQKEIFDQCRGPDSLPVLESPVAPGYVKPPSGVE
jgi:hypothetical protein